MHRLIEEVCMPSIARPLTALIAILLSLPALVMSADKESTYDIEVLVIENRMPDLLGDEMLLRDSAKLRLQTPEGAAPPNPPAAGSYFQPVIVKQLSENKNFRVLAYAHWSQTLDSASKGVKPVRIVSTEKANPPELEGAIRFSMSRYLHLDVNLLFRPASEQTSSGTMYRISEQRRVKSQETHYFDHPKFGVLVRIMPVDSDSKGEKR